MVALIGKEEDEEERVKKNSLSKPKGVVLESENGFFLKKKEKYGDPWLLGKEDG